MWWFLLGVLCGIVLAFALMMALANHFSPLEPTHKDRP